MPAKDEDNKISQVELQTPTADGEWLHFDSTAIFAAKTVVVHVLSAP